MSLALDGSTQTVIRSNKIGKFYSVYLELVSKNVGLMAKKPQTTTYLIIAYLIGGHHSLILVSSASGWKQSSGPSRTAGISSCNP